MDKGIEAVFSGMVQGVGFRFTAKHLADRYKIKGWVMNLSDSRVKLAAQGSQKDLDSFLYALKEEFKEYIVDFQSQEKEPSGDYKNFQIKFHSY